MSLEIRPLTEEMVLAFRQAINVSDGIATCERVVAESSVAMSVSTLGALSMGGRDSLGLARAGLIQGDTDSVARLGVIFRNSPDPWCPEIF